MLITLLTDFGTSDYFVGAMKGAILSVNDDARIVDITHEIPPHDIEAGAFTLLQAYNTFPAQTVHLAVVDPGVGSSRRPLLIDTGDYFCVGPDNGIFSYVCDRAHNFSAFHLTKSEYFRRPTSSTFHGRDIFAPIAAALSKGVQPSALGDRVTDIVRLPSLHPQLIANGDIAGRIIHIDRFGNCITNITREILTNGMIAKGARLAIRDHDVKEFRRTFADGAADENELFAIWGSAELLEIVAFGTSAAKLIGVERGEPVLIIAAE
jgi:S-adenosylmethionine hydrolase